MDGTENVCNKCFWNPEEAGKIKVKRRAWERGREAADHDPDIQLCESLECNIQEFKAFQEDAYI